MFLKDLYAEGLILHLSTYTDMGETSDTAGVEGSGWVFGAMCLKGISEPKCLNFYGFLSAMR